MDCCWIECLGRVAWAKKWHCQKILWLNAGNVCLCSSVYRVTAQTSFSAENFPSRLPHKMINVLFPEAAEKDCSQNCYSALLSIIHVPLELNLSSSLALSKAYHKYCFRQCKWYILYWEMCWRQKHNIDTLKFPLGLCCPFRQLERNTNFIAI